VLVVCDQPGRRGLLTGQDRGDKLIAQRSWESELRDGQIVGLHGGKPTDPRSPKIRRLLAPAVSKRCGHEVAVETGKLR
jgi:hypothetical protein